MSAGSFAAFPGAPHVGVLFVEAFGRLTRDTGRAGLASDEEDLYSIFRARAELLGWSAPLSSSSSGRNTRPRPALWGLHEAELSASDGTARIGWVQVGLETSVELSQALPPLAQCFADALGRFGTVELSGLQVTASSLPAIGEPIAWDLISGLNWFNIVPAGRTNAMIAFDSGLLQTGGDADLLARLQHLNTGPFEFGPLVPASPEYAIEIPAEAPVTATLTPAPQCLSVTLPEWSAASAAWTLAIVIHLARTGDTRAFAVRVTRGR